MKNSIAAGIIVRVQTIRRKDGFVYQRRRAHKTVEQWNAEIALVESKRCSRCGHTLSIDKFKSFTQKCGRHRFRSMCAICEYEYATEKVNQCRASDPEKLNRKYLISRLKTRYGITLDQFEELKKTHGKICCICKKQKKLHIDHCHGTKRFVV